MKKTAVLLPVLLAVIPVCGCVTPVTIRAEPEGAKIYLDGRLEGVTTCCTALRGGLIPRYAYRIEAPGCESLEGRLGKEIKWVFTFVIGRLPLPMFHFGPHRSYLFVLDRRL